MKPRTLLPPTVHSSKRTEIRSREWRYSLVNLYPTRSGRMWTSHGAKRQAAAEAAVGSRPQSRLSQRIRVKHSSIFLSLYRSLRYPHILVLLLWVLSFSTSSYFRIPTQRISLACSYEAANAGILDTRERRRDRSRGEALCIGNFKS